MSNIIDAWNDHATGICESDCPYCERMRCEHGYIMDDPNECPSNA